MSFKILALKMELTALATILKLRFGLIFHAHIAENNTSTFYFIKEINFIKENWRKFRMKILGHKIELIVGANTQFSLIILDQIDF